MPEYKDITKEELKQWMDEGKDFVLIDVLSKESYDSRHLPGARHVSAKDDDFLEQVARLVTDKATPVVVYCASFSCQLSPSAAKKLAEAGYENVYDFDGGLADWEEGGYQFEKVQNE